MLPSLVLVAGSVALLVADAGCRELNQPLYEAVTEHKVEAREAESATTNRCIDGRRLMFTFAVAGIAVGVAGVSLALVTYSRDRRPIEADPSRRRR